MKKIKSFASCCIDCESSSQQSAVKNSLRRSERQGEGSSQINMTSSSLRLRVQDRYVVMENGIVEITLSKPEGIVTGIRYGGIDNLLEVLNSESNRGYWDLFWNPPGGKGIFDVIACTDFSIAVQDEEQIELSFRKSWDTSLEGKYIPLNIDKRFVLLKRSSGFYTYSIYEHLVEWPGFEIGSARVTFKLRKDKFQYMAVAENRQRIMPMPEDRLPGRSQRLAYEEAVLLVNPLFPELKGEVDDKYQYSCENKDNKVHGWICANDSVGFWQITPSNEFRTAGPHKQNLTSHVGPTTLAMFHSNHYGGNDISLTITQGEHWKKVYGPVFIYLNSAPKGGDPRLLWKDAENQMMIEVQQWPYSFPSSDDYLKANQRGILYGRLLVRDRYVSENNIFARGANIGLALPGEVGSWQKECKGYQFWTTVDENGCFSISNICPGDYNLYAWVPGFIGDYRYDSTITILSASNINIGDIVYEPPREGPTLWEIGFPDRSAAEFYVPDPDPNYVNKLYINHPERFRQYGLWDRYTDLYPDSDLIYKVGTSDYRKDWFFAHVVRRKDSAFVGTTWQIKFELDKVVTGGKYKLRIALAAATLAELQVRVNDPKAARPLFTTGLIGRDNSIARHGIHGLYWLYHVDVPGNRLVEGENTLFFTQPRCTSPFQGFMYDYICLEAPPT